MFSKKKSAAWVCLNCGVTLDVSYKFCPHCGNPQVLNDPVTEEKAVSNAQYCNACGAELLPGQMFCGSCGTAVKPDKKKRPVIIAIVAIAFMLAVAAVVALLVSKNMPDSIKLNYRAIFLDCEETFELTYSIEPEEASDSDVKWSSSDTDIAEVDDGVVTAISEGECVITAKTKNGKTAECKVHVEPQKPDSIDIAESSASIEIGETIKLSYEVEPDNLRNFELTWRSSNPNVAVVDEKGTVTGIKAGVCTISVETENGKYDRCELTVESEKPDKIDIVKSSATIKVGDSLELAYNVEPKDIKDFEPTWESSDTSIATVNNKGVVTGVSAGSCTITAKIEDGKYDKCEVTIEAPSPENVIIGSWKAKSSTIYEDDNYDSFYMITNPPFTLEVYNDNSLHFEFNLTDYNPIDVTWKYTKTDEGGNYIYSTSNKKVDMFFDGKALYFTISENGETWQIQFTR